MLRLVSVLSLLCTMVAAHPHPPHGYHSRPSEEQSHAIEHMRIYLHDPPNVPPPPPYVPIYAPQGFVRHPFDWRSNPFYVDSGYFGRPRDHPFYPGVQPVYPVFYDVLSNPFFTEGRRGGGRKERRDSRSDQASEGCMDC